MGSVGGMGLTQPQPLLCGHLSEEVASLCPAAVARGREVTAPPSLAEGTG